MMKVKEHMVGRLYCLHLTRSKGTLTVQTQLSADYRAQKPVNPINIGGRSASLNEVLVSIDKARSSYDDYDPW
jgi:hypothetical protein